MPSEWQSMFSFGMFFLAMGGVALIGREVVKAAVGNPIPYEMRRSLEERYGEWAVATAIAVCPMDDMRCIEREAKRLYEARLLRR